MSKEAQDYILSRSKIDPDTECWMWSGGLDNKGGYGVAHWPPFGKVRRAHRMSYMAFVGPIPIGMMVLHNCDRPSCANPRHLRVGTAADNARDCVERLRKSYGELNVLHKLTTADVLYLRSPTRTETLLEVSRRTGISEGVVGKAYHSKTWKHLPPAKVRSLKP